LLKHWRMEFMKQVFPILRRPTTPMGPILFRGDELLRDFAEMERERLSPEELLRMDRVLNAVLSLSSLGNSSRVIFLLRAAATAAGGLHSVNVERETMLALVVANVGMVEHHWVLLTWGPIMMSPSEGKGGGRRRTFRREKALGKRKLERGFILE